jgi:hypothetical protein
METIEQQRQVTSESGLDEILLAHMPRGKLYRGESMLDALCGARLMGYPAPDEHPRCKECERQVEAFLQGTIR